MKKNIAVIDQNGNNIGSTYQKRAQGLIKKGRAHWIGDNAICLRAEIKESEANKMAVNIYELFDNQLSKMQEQLRDEDAEAAMPVRMQILKTIETLRGREQDAKLTEMIAAQLEMMQRSLEAETAPEAAAARETTRQKILELMTRLIDNKDKQTDHSENIVLTAISDTAEN